MSFYLKEARSLSTQVQTDGHPPQPAGTSRVAAVGPYIQFSTMPRGPLRHELLVKPAYPDGTSTLPMQEVQARGSPGGVPRKPPLGTARQYFRKLTHFD